MIEIAEYRVVKPDGNGYNIKLEGIPAQFNGYWVYRVEPPTSNNHGYILVR